MSEENKALARSSWEEIVNKQNPQAIDEVYTPDFVWHEPDQDIRGYEQARQFVSTFFAAFPDINITVEDVIAEGDKVVTRYTIRGTHRGETEEFGPPTEKRMELQGITIHRFEDSKDSRGVGALRQSERTAAARARSRTVAGRQLATLTGPGRSRLSPSSCPYSPTSGKGCSPKLATRYSSGWYIQLTLVQG